MGEPLVSIILSNHNGFKHLKECFTSLNNLKYRNFEIIFIDNNSTDNSVDFIKNNYKKIIIIENKKDYGFAKANNIAASYANGNYLALLNIDTIVDKEWLSELVKVAENSKEIGIVVSKMYYFFDKKLINYAGGRSDKYGKTHHIGKDLRDNKLLNIQTETFYACGAAILIKKELYKMIGLFDPYYYGYCEDLDLSWRAWLFGYKVIYAPKSFIYHKIGQIFKDLPLNLFFYSEKNKLRTILKNYQLISIFKILPVYIVKRIGIFLRAFRRPNESPKDFITVYVKAFYWNIIHLKSLIQYRKWIQAYRIKNDEYIFNLMNRSVKLDENLSKLRV